MNLIDFALVLLVGSICGVIAQLTSSYSKGGWVIYPLLGVFGALTGVLVSRSLNAPELFNLTINMSKFPLIYAILGAVLFLAGVSFFVKPGRG